MSALISKQRLRALPAAVWVLLWGNFFVRGSYFMVWPFISVLLYQQYQLSATTIGLLLTGSAAAAVALSFYAGFLSDRFGRKHLMFTATILGVVTYSTFAIAESLPMLVLCVLMSALPRALWDSPSKAWLGDLLPDAKDRELALQGLYFMTNAGAALGPLLGIWAGTNGNQYGFFCTAGAYGLLCLSLVWLYRQRSVQMSQQAFAKLALGKTLQLLRQDHLFLLVMIANILINFVYAHGSSSLIQYLTRAEFPQLVSLISAMVVLNSVVIVTCQFPLLHLMQHWPVMRRIHLGIFILALAQLCFAFNPLTWYWGWLGATLLLSIAEAILFANMNVHLDQLAPKHLRGSYFGAAGLYALGTALSPVVGGLMLDYFGGAALYLFSAVLCLLVYWCYRQSVLCQRPDFAKHQQEQARISCE